MCASAPNRRWVPDFTYVLTWSGWGYASFVIDTCALRILGWRSSTRMTTPLVLDAIEQASWTRNREGRSDLTGQIWIGADPAVDLIVEPHASPPSDDRLWSMDGILKPLLADTLAPSIRTSTYGRREHPGASSEHHVGISRPGGLKVEQKYATPDIPAEAKAVQAQIKSLSETAGNPEFLRMLREIQDEPQENRLDLAK